MKKTRRVSDKKTKYHHKAVLCILDGFGHGKDYQGNAITRARTPYIDSLKKKYPWTLLHASGEHAGIPKGTQGGSEVGHFIMGAGRVVWQSLEEINLSIRNKSFFRKEALLAAARHVKAKKSKLHILGMISDQGVHSDIRHLFALLEFAKKQKIDRVYIHAITDGRDVPERSAKKYVLQILAAARKTGRGRIATIVGRFYAMDRDNNWKRTRVAYDAMTAAVGAKNTKPLAALDTAYKDPKMTDYYIKPIVLDEQGLIGNNDAVIFFNFRTDRAKQLTQALVEKSFKKFPAKAKPNFVAFGPYTNSAPVVFPAAHVPNNMGAVIDQQKLKQLRIAETEKYAHVTYFFNSQVKEPFKTETRILVDSPKTPSYADKPEMSAHEIVKKFLEELSKQKGGHQPFALCVVNFANPDLVGHSGQFKPTVRAVETVDVCLKKIIPAALAQDYTVFLTGDHGNAEYMIYPNGENCPSHTRNPVPFIVISNEKIALKKISHRKPTGGLRDISPTILDHMAIKKPKEMTGKSLLR